MIHSLSLPSFPFSLLFTLAKHNTKQEDTKILLQESSLIKKYIFIYIYTMIKKKIRDILKRKKNINILFHSVNIIKIFFT